MILELLLSAVPGLEARTSALLLTCSGEYWLIPFAVVINFISVMVFIKLFESSMLPKQVERFFEKRLEKRAEKIEKWFKKYGNLFLFILIALPSTGIGSFTAAFIGTVLELRGWIFYITILFGIIISIVPAIFLVNGISFLGLGC